MNIEENINAEWLTRNFNNSDGSWYLNASTDEVRPIKIIVLTSGEVKDGWYISLWDGADEIVIFDGINYTINRMMQLYSVLSGRHLKDNKIWKNK